jgi:hypothetical protein
VHVWIGDRWVRIVLVYGRGGPIVTGRGRQRRTDP